MVIGLILFVWFDKNAKSIIFDIDHLSQAKGAIGTPSRTEREFKIGFTGKNHLLDTDEGLLGLYNEIAIVMRQALSSEAWGAPAITKQPYSLQATSTILVFRDIYLDTENRLNCQNSIAYRLRHRFKSAKQLHLQETHPTNPNYFPHRGEIQSKVGRVEDGFGFSRVNESRLEFRVESQPFSVDRPPPAPPWHPKEFIKIAQSGVFSGQAIEPAKLLAGFYRKNSNNRNIEFAPSNVLVSTRLRLHLNMKTGFGSGPNPDQAFIITIDRTDVFDGPDYIEFLNRGWYEGDDAVRPFIKKSFYEMEIEFERNVSTNLDASILSGGLGLEALQLRDSFLSDQKIIKNVIVNYLKGEGASPRGISISKFRQACKDKLMSSALSSPRN